MWQAIASGSCDGGHRAIEPDRESSAATVHQRYAGVRF